MCESVCTIEYSAHYQFSFAVSIQSYFKPRDGLQVNFVYMSTVRSDCPSQHIDCSGQHIDLLPRKLWGSLSHYSYSPTAACHIHLYTWQSGMQQTLSNSSMQLEVSFSSDVYFCMYANKFSSIKEFQALKSFVAHPLQRNIFLTQNFISQNFPDLRQLLWTSHYVYQRAQQHLSI